MTPIAPSTRNWRALAVPLVLLAAGAMLAGCATVADPAAPGRASAAANFSVVTLNIYHNRDHWELRRPLVIEGLRELQPDVIGLQEVLQRGDLRNQAEDIAEALGYEFHFVSTAPAGDVERYGNAILTRHPILDRSERRLRPLEDSRTVAHLRLDIHGDTVDVYNTHLHHTAEGAAMREQQLSDMLAHIEERDDGTPRVLLGDFNAEVDWPELAALWDGHVDTFAQLNPDAVDVTTLNPHYFGDDRRRIDHVLVERDRFEILESRLVLDRPDAAGTWPSDHFGVLARLRVVHTR